MINKKTKKQISQYFPERKSLGGRVKFELDLSNYATKADVKYAAGVDTSKFAKRIDLASLKSNVDQLDFNKLKNVPNNLRNLKSKVDKLDGNKLVPAPTELSKLSDVVTRYEMMHVMLRSNMLKMKYLILLTWLLILLFMLK